MSVYVDNANIPASVQSGGRAVTSSWCHMTADTRGELDAMADLIGLRRAWIQHPGTWKEHYDLTSRRRVAAVAAGAVEVDAREHVRWLAARREHSTRPEEGDSR